MKPVQTAAAAPQARRFVESWLPGLVLLLGLLLTLGFWKGFQAAHQREVQAYFDYRSRDALSRLTARLQQYEQALLGAQGLFQASETVSRREFATFVEALKVGEQYPGIQGIGFSLLVPGAELPRHVADLRAQGFPDYRVRPEGPREVYSSIVYLEPFANRNLRAFGYDMLSEPVRRQAMSQARDTGFTTMSGKVVLVQETDRDIQAGFLVYLPVYRDWQGVQTVEDRRRNLRGWVYAPFRMNDLMQGVLGEAGTDLELKVYDGPAASPATLMYEREPGLSGNAPALLQTSRTLTFGGHAWTVVTQALPGLLARHGRDHSRLVLALGALTSLLFWWIARLLSRQLRLVREANESLEARVEQRTRELQESEVRFRLMADHAPALIWVSGPDGLCTYFNRVWLEFTGRSLLQELGNGWLEGVHPEDRESCLQVYRSHLYQRLEFTMDYRLRHADGQYRWLADQGMPRFDADGTFLGYIGSCVDITGRKHVEESLRQERQRLESIIKGTNIGTWEWNVQTGEVVVNERWAGILGYTLEELAPTSIDTWTRLAHPEDLKASTDLLARHFRGEVDYYEIESRMRHKDGSWAWVLDRGRVSTWTEDGQPLLMMGTHTDITARKTAEAERALLEDRNHQLQKAESLGLMAGSIAHHFNNKLQAVMANLEVISLLPKGADPSRFLALAKQASLKAAEVSRQMLTYLGQSSVERAPLRLADACQAALPSLRDTLPGQVELVTEFGEPDALIHANADQVQQILANLMTNAWEAMGEAGGSLRLRLLRCPSAAIPTVHRFPIGWQPQGPVHACLEVADGGCGIASEAIEKLFDPFFSTKFTGRGLGLPVVLGLAHAHGGGITVESVPGQGSVFRVYFPLLTETPPPPPAEVAPQSRVLAGGTVLLVDDDAMLLQSSSTLIELAGFPVLTARDGLEAVAVFQQHQGEIRWVITDLTMPRMDGWETLSALRRLDPALPVILMSGYDKVQVLSGIHPDQPQAFLSKPFDLQHLLDALSLASTGR